MAHYANKHVIPYRMQHRLDHWHRYAIQKNSVWQHVEILTDLDTRFGEEAHFTHERAANADDNLDLQCEYCKADFCVCDMDCDVSIKEYAEFQRIALEVSAGLRKAPPLKSFADFIEHRDWYVHPDNHEVRRTSRSHRRHGRIRSHQAIAMSRIGSGRA